MPSISCRRRRWSHESWCCADVRRAGLGQSFLLTQILVVVVVHQYQILLRIFLCKYTKLRSMFCGDVYYSRALETFQHLPVAPS
jgi:hypothetical protein